jgi:hypothetical protein
VSLSVGEPEKRLRNGRLPERILDLLQTDGGWMVTAAIATVFDNPLQDTQRSPTRRALFRLRDRGLVISRPSDPGALFAVENEWRVR